MPQKRVQSQHLTGTIQRPGERPQSVRLNLEPIREDDAFVTVTDTAYTVEGKTFILADDDTAAGVVTVTLPPTLESSSRVVHVKKLGATANVLVRGDGTETIDGATTKTLGAQYEAVALLCDGDAWYVL